MENRQTITSRQAEILHLVSKGYTAREIGSQLFISARTVENHLCHIQMILGTNNAAHSVGEAYRRKILSDFL